MQTQRGLGIGAVVFLFCNLAVAMAQVTTGTISGTVQDSTGAVVPGVNITIRNTETGLTRAVASDEAGRYRAPNLPLGAYEVEGSKAGFQTEVRRGITLTVGREAVVNLPLKVGAVAERVEVTGEAPLVDTTSASMEFLVDDKKIRDLPLNGRNYTQLAVLQPGVTPYKLYGDNLSVGHGQGLSIAGARVDQNSFLMDGQDITDYAGRTPGSVTGSNLGVDAIREFSVLSGSYSAEYGLVSGGVMNVVTNSGTNQLHGSGFEFLRNNKLDAKNFFDPARDPIPPFKRNQFGGTVSGPIITDRMFFLGAFEGLRERLGLTKSSPVPNARAHAGFLPDAAGGEVFIGISPLMRNRMDIYPLPNGQDFGDGTALLTSNPNSPSRDDYVMGRIDYQLNNNNSLFGRYTFDHATTELPEDIPFFIYTKRSRYQYALISLTSIVNSATVNEARIGFNRSIASLGGRSNFSLCADLNNCPQLGIVKGLPLVTAWTIRSPSITGGMGGGHLSEVPRRFAMQTFEFADNISYTRGSHTLKTGAVYRRYYANPRNNFGLSSGLVFNTLREFMQGNPITISGQDIDSQYSWQESLFGWFVQDTIRLRQRLTLNVGLRHEFATDPYEKHGRMAALRNLNDTNVTPGTIFHSPKANFSPRVGLAWDVFGDGRTSVRMGGGIYQEQMIPTTPRFTFSKIFPFHKQYALIRTSEAAPILPDLVLDLNALPSTANAPSIWEFEPNIPSKYQWNFEVQREFVAGTTLSAAYMGSRYLHNEVRKSVNNFVPGRLPDGRKCFLTAAPCNAPGRRKNPVFGSLNGQNWEGDSYYQSLQFNLIRRFSRGLQYQASYTWARSIDTQTANFAGVPQGLNDLPVQDPDNMRGDRGLSAMDVRHILTANVTYDLPFGNGLSGAGKMILAGWQVNVMPSLRTGFAFTAATAIDRSGDGQGGGADRPDLGAGMSNNPVSGTTTGCPGVPAGQKLQTVERYFDPCAFTLPAQGTYGNLGANTIIGPGSVNFDMAVHKTFNFTERLNLQFRGEFFNLFNTASFGDFARSIFRSATGGLHLPVRHGRP
ncbi:MAG: hypothetical protein A3J28_18735, partial [Acidobacteria bacterium RIFCSPLOWO2_12_FULL_60_22]